MIVGAGTVLTVEQVHAAVEAGAQFIVSPGFSTAIAEECTALDVPYFPGATTPTEYQMALSYGYEVVKLFPAEQSGGLAKIKALSAPFPMFKVMPTGGISLKNLEEYLSCPVIDTIVGDCISFCTILHPLLSAPIVASCSIQAQQQPCPCAWAEKP